MKTFLQLQNTHATDLPAALRDDDVRYPDSLVTHFLHEFTAPGAVVFDPFAGFGTTLRVAEDLGRAGWGLEWDAARVAYSRAQLQHPQRLLHGDARQLATYDLPTFDFCMTSPPYMNQGDRENPFTAYSTAGQGYAAYLADIQAIYGQIAARLQPSGHAVIEVANLRGTHGVTPLAWDVARAVGAVLPFQGEVVIGWDHYGYGYDHSYALVFRKPGP
ncbi:MAG: site-specific DNA-methyltransferase [Chloroflexota bacterium]|nr:site-specific DNA-methyltransferase [Chloroflexota bacterium]